VSGPAQLAHIGLGKESTWGSGVAPSVFLPASKDVNIEIARMRIEGPHATVAQLRSEAGRKSIRGNMSGVPGYTDAIGHVLRALLGEPSTSGSGTYTHTWRADNPPVNKDYARPPYSLQWTADGVTRRFTGGQLSQVTFSQPADDYLKLNLDWLFKSHQDGVSEATPTYPTDAVFGFRDLAVKRAGSDIPVRVESLELTINNNLEPANAAGDDEIAAVDLGVVTVEVQFTVEFNDADIYNDFINDQAQRYDLIWSKGGKSLTITIHRGVIAAHSQPIPASGRLTATFTVAAELDPSSGNFVDVVLVNTTASY